MTTFTTQPHPLCSYWGHGQVFIFICTRLLHPHNDNSMHMHMYTWTWWSRGLSIYNYVWIITFQMYTNFNVKTSHTILYNIFIQWVKGHSTTLMKPWRRESPTSGVVAHSWWGLEGLGRPTRFTLSSRRNLHPYDKAHSASRIQWGQ